MKPGDLIKMKYAMFWQLKGDQHQQYSDQPLLVLEQAHNTIKIMLPGGLIKSDLAENYEVI